MGGETCGALTDGLMRGAVLVLCHAAVCNAASCWECLCPGRPLLLLQPPKASLQHPPSPSVAAVADRCDTLGVTGVAVEAQLYTLLLYKEGSHFSVHRDTEKAENMWGEARSEVLMALCSALCCRCANVACLLPGRALRAVQWARRNKSSGAAERCT